MRAFVGRHALVILVGQGEKLRAALPGFDDIAAVLDRDEVVVLAVDHQERLVDVSGPA